MVKMMDKKRLDHIFEKLPDRIRIPLQRARSAFEDKVTEIVLRTNAPVCIYERKRMFFITDNGFLTDSAYTENLLTASSKEMEQIVLRLCDYSVYAFQNEINSGFITIDGGVRVGLCGKAVINKGEITNVRDISSLSFRVARDISGCATSLIQKLDPLGGVLICGVPGSGKTTLIRDAARQLSYRYRVSVLDERGELSAFHRGKSGFSLGLCDVYNGYPKGNAANCAIRSMAPEIIVCDEMGDQSDVDLLLYSMRCGVAFIATVHASSMQDLRRREITSKIINTGAFRYIVFLSSDGNVGKIDKIYEMCDAHD
ncbi:stage III sporulation protein AA [uncultured Ruminococcus sp.]|uniref:stage III sporulation protein AA n=1 Tax=uncultured Ruminococcus sp. TaxID=165186 RepID=UPI002931C692|nr:stage III sporulation protein AA [uncultured Ruminococcus sp.]